MESKKNLAEQTRSLIDRLNVRQVMISNELKTIANQTTGTLKKSKSVSFDDDDIKTSIDRSQPRSILKKQEDINDETCPLEPFVVNIPDNISRIDIDQYLKNIQDQRRKGLNYSYNTDDDEDDDDEEEEAEIKEKRTEPWNEVSIKSYTSILILISSSSNIGVHYSMKVMIVMFIIIPFEHQIINNKFGQQIMSNKLKFVA
jgi:hypothetical protein